MVFKLFAILQKYDFSSKSQLVMSHYLIGLCCLRYCKSTIFQANHNSSGVLLLSCIVVCDTAKVRFFKQITTEDVTVTLSKCCLRYCKSTIFQANHNIFFSYIIYNIVVCDTAKVRFFKQITTDGVMDVIFNMLFAILQKYDFSSKSQPHPNYWPVPQRCLRYCKSTIFQANHNRMI